AVACQRARTCDRTARACRGADRLRRAGHGVHGRDRGAAADTGRVRERGAGGGTVRRVLPQPGVSAMLLVTWLLLHNDVSAGVFLSGALLAVALPRWTLRFWPEYPRTVRLRPLLRLIGVVLYDIVVANMRMVVLILGPRRRLRPEFIVVPVNL